MQGNMFVVEGPGSKELLSNWKRAPGAGGHQMLHSATKNLITWNIPEINKTKQRI